MDSKFARRSVILRYLSFVGLACLVSLLLTPHVANAAKPNIVVILADDMGYGDVQALNPDSKIPTPNLDGLAASGMTFLESHSPSAVCTPTRYGLLTGRYCWRSTLKRGVLGGYSKPLLGKGQATIATMLHANGYRTGAIGKWHLGMEMPTKSSDADTKRWDGDPGIDFGGVITDSPIHHGFDYYFGVSASLDMAPYVYIRNDRFANQPTIQQSGVKFPHFIRSGPRSEDFVVDEVLDRITDEATSFVTESAKDDNPFFLYVPFTAPHKPTQPHKRFQGKTELGEYGDFVAQTDWSVGQILSAIDAAGIADNTLVVYTSDNGSYMHRYDNESDAPADHVSNSSKQGFYAKNHRANGPFRGTKADIYEAGHHVPFFVRWPGKVAAGSHCTEPICHVDLFATFAEITNGVVENGAAEDSHSIHSMMMGDSSAKRAVPVVHHSVGGMFAIRDGNWKLIFGNGSGGREKPRGKNFQKPYQLYDMSVDTAERTNVATQHPDVVERLTSSLEKIRGSVEPLKKAG